MPLPDCIEIQSMPFATRQFRSPAMTGTHLYVSKICADFGHQIPQIAYKDALPLSC
jgi:hypothetical protein